MFRHKMRIGQTIGKDAFCIFEPQQY